MFDLFRRPQSQTTRPKRALSIRARLMVLALIAIAPLLVDHLRDIQNERRDLIAQANTQALTLARQAMSADSEVILVTRAFLQVVASARSTFTTSDTSCSEFLGKSAGRVPWLKTLSVANLQGQIICSSFSDAIGLDISEREYFNRAIDSSDFVVSDYFIGTRVKSPLIAAALAQRGTNGAAAAVVIATIDLSWFTRIAASFSLRPGAMMMLIDSKGTVLARYPDADAWVGRQFTQHPLTHELMARVEGTATMASYDGTRRIVGFAQVPGTETRVAVGLSESDVLAHVNRAIYSTLIELGGIAALLLLAIWFGGERMLVRPIRALSAIATRIGHGGRATSPAAELPWAAEFVPLAAALDDMAGQLGARERELLDSNMQLRELAQIDPLTGLANRRLFNTRLASEWTMAGKQGQKLAVLMIDVDFFKLFNDQYGHVQGDNCLRKVAMAIKASVRLGAEPGDEGEDPAQALWRLAAQSRKPDCAARYGGEEFAILLQGADLDTAMQIAERLRDSIERLLIAHAGSPHGVVTVSVGAASMHPVVGANPEALTQAADAALYQAKQRGRNLVVAGAEIELSRAS
ncbi:MAG TPA: GGDEF domain-containing protein [Pseudolabrys sp.]|nr:GGDEF domain-containing protein [Pseudolabrys sp.]